MPKTTPPPKTVKATKTPAASKTARSTRAKKTYTYKGKQFTSEPAMVLHLLDDYRCIEGFAARYLGNWRAISRLACVTGGLRTVCGREQLHADLLAERLRELGGTPQCEVPQERLADLTFYSSPEHSDVEKLGKVARRLSNPEQVLQFLSEAIEQITEDQDTRELLVTIRDDERATIHWILESWKTLQPTA
jgi:bacterioferritin (cytochrome b1)